MSTWTNLINALFIPGRPILGSIGVALRDNLIAAFEGAANAVRLRIGALQRVTAGTAVRSASDAFSISVAPVTGGVTRQSRSPYFGVLQHGTLRLTLAVTSLSGTAGADVIRVRNRVSTTLVSRSSTGSSVVDVDVRPGDSIEVQVSGTSTSSSSASATAYLTISTGGEDLWPGIPAPLEGNTYNA